MTSTAPSREFMIRQAVLNAVWNEYRHMLKGCGGSVAAALWFMAADTELISANLIVAITKEFHKLEARFARAA